MLGKIHHRRGGALALPASSSVSCPASGTVATATAASPARVSGAVVLVALAAVTVAAACARTSSPAPGSPASAAAQGGAAPAFSTVTAPSPPLILIPAAVARQALVASFVMPSLDRSVESAVVLVRQASPLPLDAAGIRDLLLTQLGLPADLSKHLDLRAPVAGAAVASKAGSAPLVAFSVAARSPADITALMAAAGQIIERRGDAVQIQAPTGERGWFLTVGNVVVIADSQEAMVLAGQLALDERSGPAKDDVSVVVFPDAMARATGTTVRAELDRALARIDAAGESGGEGRHRAASSPASAQHSRQLREFADYLADATSVEVGLDVDPTRGLGLALRLSPRPGSKLETLAAEAHTIALDPLLGDGSENAALVLTSGYGARNLEALRRARAEVLGASPEASAGAARFLDSLIAGLAGDASAIVRVTPLLSVDAVYPIGGAENAAKIQAAMGAVDRPAVAGVLRTVLDRDSGELKVSSVRAETFGKVRGLHATMTWLAPPPGGSRRAFERLFGHKSFDVFLAVVPGNRLAMTVGPGAKVRLAAMAAGTPTARSTALTSALAGAGARSIFASADLREAIRFGLGFGEEARARAIGDSLSAPMPVMGGVTGDPAHKKLTVDLLLPPACFAGMGGLLQAAFTMRN